jgi:hypothetical protein
VNGATFWNTFTTLGDLSEETQSYRVRVVVRLWTCPLLGDLSVRVGSILLILLIIAAVKFVLFGGILFAVFRDDIREWLRGKPEPVSPECTYCQSKWTVPTGDPQTRWEDNSLILVTEFHCQHCHFPFWHVERVPVSSLKTG